MDLLWLWFLSLNEWITIPSFFVGISGLTFFCFPISYRFMHWIEESNNKMLPYRWCFLLFFFAFLMGGISSRELFRGWSWLVIFVGLVLVSLFTALLFVLVQRFSRWYFIRSNFSLKKRIISSVTVALVALLFIYAP